MAFMFFGSLNLDSGPRYGSLLAPVDGSDFSNWQELMWLAYLDAKVCLHELMMT